MIHYIHRRQFLTGLAMQTMGDCPHWDAALTEYLRTQELQWAFEQWGPLHVATDEHTRAQMLAKETREAEDNARVDVLFAKYQRQETIWQDEYIAAFDSATFKLAKTPAPNVAAATFKAQMVDVDEVWNEQRFPLDCLQIIRDDFARLSASSEVKQHWNGLVERFEAVEADPEVTEESIDLAGDLIGQIMALPAPDADATRWKLDWLFSDGDDSTASYSKDFLAQLFADYRRFLGGEARS